VGVIIVIVPAYNSSGIIAPAFMPERVIIAIARHIIAPAFMPERQINFCKLTRASALYKTLICLSLKSSSMLYGLLRIVSH
jgi:hypothetical protein